MVVRIKRQNGRAQLLAASKKMVQGKRLDAYKFCGTVKWKEDGLSAQKRMRDEWN
jgi:hypothetical protein